STLSNKDRAETGPDGTLGEQPPRDSQPGKETEPFPSPAAPEPAAGSPAVPVIEEGTGNGEQSTTDESVTKVEDAAAQPSLSPTNSTQENTGDNNANTENGTSSAESESTNT
ncbi:uncharacterized protein TM35_001891000, partial [Trypanosoma theileri]